MVPLRRHRALTLLILAGLALTPALTEARRATTGKTKTATAVQLPTAVRLTGATFERSDVAASSAPAAKGSHFNVVLVVMESTGLSYALEPQYGKLAMPFLHKLASEGLSLTQHYSPANTSPRSIAALFTGLYPMPERRIYAMSKDLHLPTIVNRLGASYSSLFVTPGSLKWYFPLDLLKRNGPREVYGYERLPVRKRAPRFSMAKHEIPTVAFFLKKLDELATKPFFATYYSFVAHWPYPDFGAEYRRFAGRSPKFKYLNNLYLLDKQIERIYQKLAASKVLDKTIIVLVGDHGEAWGQHKKNFNHSRASFNENYQTPAIFWQPKVFAPRKVTAPTTHVDVLPTVLDALGMPYNDKLVQGASLLRGTPRRRYIFLVGNEGVVSSVSHAGLKLQLELRPGGHCWAYDLAADPQEKKRLECKTYAEQRAATERYRAIQRKLLRAYNKACKTGTPYGGERHPAPPSS